MNWSKSLSTTEYLFIFLFLALYGWYFFRVHLVSKKVGTTARSIIIKTFLRGAAFSLLIIALLGPSFGISEIEARATSKDIFIAVDLSNSMDAQDIAPTRLERTKMALIQLVEGLSGNRIGLIIFAKNAILRTPLTYDTYTLKSHIQQLATWQMKDQGSDLINPLILAQNKFAELASQSHTARVVFLFTDGEHFGSSTPDQLRFYPKNKIHTFFIGIGTPEGGNIKMAGKTKVDSNGNPVVTKRNDLFLREISNYTKSNVNYLSTTNPGDLVFQLIESTQSIQSGSIDLRKILIANDKYYYFLLLGLILLSLDIIITIQNVKL